MNHNLKLKALEKRAEKEKERLKGLQIKSMKNDLNEIKERLTGKGESLQTKPPSKDQVGNDKWQQKKQGIVKNRPYCITKKGIGYLKFGKYGEKIKIGRTNSKAFRLLQCLTEPFGVAKSVETVFEAMYEKDRKRYSEINDPYLNKARKIQLITNSGIKELQKDNKLRGKLKFQFDEVKSKIWLEYLG